MSDIRCLFESAVTCLENGLCYSDFAAIPINRARLPMVSATSAEIWEMAAYATSTYKKFILYKETKKGKENGNKD